MSNEFGQRLHHIKYKNGKPVVKKGWRAFRKYDGHSTLWLPITINENLGYTGLWSLGRSNKPEPINAPKWFLDSLPKRWALHGELWNLDDRPQSITSATKDIPIDEEWKDLRLVVFAFPQFFNHFNPNDVDSYKSIESDTPWKLARKNFLENIDVDSNPVLMMPVEVSIDTNPEDFGWEGLVFQDPDAVYRNGRTRSVLKHKPTYEDEAIVIGYNDGKLGRTGTVGSLQVEYTVTDKMQSIHGCPKDIVLGSKVEFSVGGLNSSEWLPDTCKEVYPIGSELHFEFLCITNHGLPHHCSVYRSKK